MTTYRTILVTNQPAAVWLGSRAPAAITGSGMTLVNKDGKNSIWVGESPTLHTGDSDTIELPAMSSMPLPPELDTWAISATAAGVSTSLIPASGSWSTQVPTAPTKVATVSASAQSSASTGLIGPTIVNILPANPATPYILTNVYIVGTLTNNSSSTITPPTGDYINTLGALQLTSGSPIGISTGVNNIPSLAGNQQIPIPSLSVPLNYPIPSTLGLQIDITGNVYSGLQATAAFNIIVAYSGG